MNLVFRISEDGSEMEFIIIIIIINFIFTQDTHITEVFFSGVLQLYKLH